MSKATREKAKATKEKVKATKAKAVKEKNILKKNARKEAYDKLLTVFSEYKNETNIKKFDRKIEKVAKLFESLIVKSKSEMKL